MTKEFDPEAPRPRGELDHATVEAMRAAIASAAVRPPSPPPEEGPAAHDGGALHAALRRAAREARERAIPPEQLLVTLKLLWRAAFTEQSERTRTVASERQRADQDRRLGELVTLCIAEYFRDE
jgi:hypothetical protein